jgi:hypothetical protein
MKEIIDQVRDAWPPLFAGTSIDDLSGGALTWVTVQNKRCMGEIPDECFVRSGPKVLVVRDRFLDWWQTTMRPARETKPLHIPPKARAGQRRRHSAPEVAAQSDYISTGLAAAPSGDEQLGEPATLHLK